MKGAISSATSRGNDSKLAVKNKRPKARKYRSVYDPNKPRMPDTTRPYFVFKEGFEPEFKAKNPNKSYSELCKAGGEKWRSLSDSEKAPFITKAAQNKAEYYQKIKAYNRKLAGEADDECDKSKPKDNDGEGDDDECSGEVSAMEGAKSKASAKGNDSELAVMNKQTEACKEMVVKDPNKPKGASGPFFVFLEEFRPEFKAKNPNEKSFTVIAKACGEKWKSLSESEKAPFIAKAAQNKAEYEKFMKGAKSKASVKGNDSKLAVKNKPLKARKAKTVNDPNKPKYPTPMFYIFMEEFRLEFKAKNPNEKSSIVINQAGGKKWRSLSDSEKAPFIAEAARRKAEYEKKIEAYNRKLAGEADDESDKSKSEVNNGEEDSGEEEEDDD